MRWRARFQVRKGLEEALRRARQEEELGAAKASEDRIVSKSLRSISASNARV